MPNDYQFDPTMSEAGSPAGATEALRRLRALLGIEPSSPLDVGAKAIIDAPTNAARAFGQAGQSAWSSLAKAPRPTPSPGAIPQATAPAGVPYMGGAPAEPPPPNPIRSGIGWKGGRSLGTEQALSGLKGFQDQREAESIRTHIPTEELWQQSYRPAEQTAPGAGQWASTELKQRLGDEDFMKALLQQAEKSVSEAQTSLNPVVQAGAEATARRAAYPAEAQAKGLAEQARIQAEPQSKYYDFLQRQLEAGGAGGVSSISKSGVTFAGVPQQALSQLRDAQVAVKRGGFWGPSAEAKANLRAARQNVMLGLRLPPHIHQALQTVLDDPNAPIDQSQFTPQEIDQMESLYSVLSDESQ